MAERSAIASGFSLSEIGTEGGCCLKVAVGGGTTRFRGSGRSIGASCATETVGVMGDTGGRFGERDWERRRSRWSEGVEELEGELDRVLVSTRSAGMARMKRGPESVSPSGSVDRERARRRPVVMIRLCVESTATGGWRRAVAKTESGNVRKTKARGYLRGDFWSRVCLCFGTV